LDAHEILVIYDAHKIGNHALFLGRRCLSVDATKFASVEANCVYFAGDTGTGLSDDYAFKYNLSTEKEERIIPGAANRNPVNPVLSNVPRPLSFVQLLTRYTMVIPYSELYLEIESEEMALDTSVYYED